MSLLKNILLSVVEVSVSTGVIVLIMLLSAPLFHRRYAARWRYYIWIALAVRLVVPVNFSLPERNIEISIPASASASVADIAGDGMLVMPQAAGAAQKVPGFSVLDALAVIWLAVSVGIVLVHICSYCRYKRKLVRDSRRVADEAVLRRFFALKKELKIRRKIAVIWCRNTEGPMAIGFFRTFLAIPEGAYSEEELFFIFRHELIHIKRHDTFLKFLFMSARALHWFNPVIAMMQRAAVIDMELSCDEQVVQGLSGRGRKAYTETLLSALERRCGKTNALTTQFNGGSRIMKKRFQNILGRSGRKRGLFLLMLAVCMTLTLGMMTGCTVAQTESPESTDVQGNQAQRAEEREAQQGKGSSERDQVQVGTGDVQNSSQMSALSEDAMEIGDIAADFSRAYFDGDQEELRKFLADSYDGDIEIYPDAEPEVAGMTAVKGLEDIGKSKIGDTQVVSVACDRANMGEGFLYLTLEMVKQENGWKVYFYGLEM